MGQRRPLPALVVLAALTAFNFELLAFSLGSARPGARATSLRRPVHARLSTRARAAAGALQGTLAAELEVGQEVEGSVKRHLPFGAFVDIGAERQALVKTEELQEGLPMERLKRGAKVKGRILHLEDGKVWMTLRSGSLERPFDVTRTPDLFVKEAALEGVPADHWFEATVSGLLFGKGAIVEFTQSGCSEPAGGMLHRREFSAGLEDTITRGTRVRVRILSYDHSAGRLDFSMKEPGKEEAGAVGEQEEAGAVGMEDSQLRPLGTGVGAPDPGRPRRLRRPVLEGAAVRGAGGRVAGPRNAPMGVVDPPPDAVQGTPVAELEVGQEVEGFVQTHRKFGAFVDIGAEREALVKTEELQEGLPMEKLKTGAKVKGRILHLEDGKVWMTLRSGSLERPFDVTRAADLFTREAALEGVPADQWFEGTVSSFLLGKGVVVEITPPGCSEPAGGVLHHREFCAGLADTITRGARVRVRILAYDHAAGRLDFSMKEP